ncbi:MAG: hypothetical protein IJ711_07690, partial [Lachnospiraceae bacterium]|nr:hypothetical protein [Lachnospiraceae bacterium]
ENRLTDAVVLVEVPSDQGRVDILLVLPPCIKIVLELKMAGSGYPLSYARHAGVQLEEYMQRMDAHIGYVLIFDGRKKENGTGFDEIKTEKLDVVTVNVAFSAPSAK